MEKGGPIRAISRSIAVLQAINRAGSMSMTDISQASGMPYSTTRRIVETLLNEGLIEREPARKHYRPTALVETLSHGFQGHGRLVMTARAPVFHGENLVGAISLVFFFIGLEDGRRGGALRARHPTSDIRHPTSDRRPRRSGRPSRGPRMCARLRRRLRWKA